MIHIPVVLALKIGAAIYQNRVRAEAARAAADATSMAAQKTDLPTPGEQGTS